VPPKARREACPPVIIEGKPIDISEEIGLDAADVADMDAIVDRFVVSRKHEKAIKAGIAATLLVGDGLMQVQVGKGASKADAERFYKALCSRTHHFVYGEIGPAFFVFNDPESACRTCGGLGVDKVTHPELLIPDPKRSILGGCFVKEAFKYNPDTWDGRMMYSLSVAIDFPLDSPWKQLPEKIRKAILYGIEKKIAIRTQPDAKMQLRSNEEGREIGWQGISGRIERHYRRYRQRGEANTNMEAWLEKGMVEQTCPDCGGARLRRTRSLFTIGGKSIYEIGQLNFGELHAFLRPLNPAGGGARSGTAGAQGNPRPPRSAPRHRARLPELQPPIGHALGRRVAADPPVDADRFRPHGHALRPRRAQHRAPPEGDWKSTS